MGILNKIFGSTSSNEDDKYVLYLGKDTIKFGYNYSWEFYIVTN